MTSPLCPASRSCLGLLAMLLASPALGQIMLSPAAVLESDLGAFATSVALENMINQSGLDRPFVSDSTPFDEYFANPRTVFAQNGVSNNWQSNFSFDLPLRGNVDFDLGASRQITGLAIWNVSIKSVTIKVLDSPTGPERVVGDFTLTNHTSFPFSYTADLLAFSNAVEGRFLRLSINSAYTFSPSDTFAYAIVGEVILSVAPLGGPALAIHRNVNGDVIVAFSGILQSASEFNGSFADVPGSPSAPYTVPKPSLTSQQFFRTRN